MEKKNYLMSFFITATFKDHPLFWYIQNRLNNEWIIHFTTLKIIASNEIFEWVFGFWFKWAACKEPCEQQY